MLALASFATLGAEPQGVVQTRISGKGRWRQHVLERAFIRLGADRVQEKGAYRHRVHVVPVQVLARPLLLAQAPQPVRAHRLQLFTWVLRVKLVLGLFLFCFLLQCFNR